MHLAQYNFASARSHNFTGERIKHAQNSPKLYSIDRLIIFQRAIFTNILPTTRLQTRDQKQHDVARHLSIELKALLNQIILCKDSCARSLVAQHLSTELKALLNRSSHNFSESNLHKHTPYDSPTNSWSKTTRRRPTYVARHLSTELKTLLNQSSIIFQRAIFVNILPTTYLRKWSQEKKSTKNTTDEKRILSKLSIPQLNTKLHTPQHKRNSNTPQLRENSNTTLHTPQLRGNSNHTIQLKGNVIQPNSKETSTQSCIISS